MTSATERTMGLFVMVGSRTCCIPLVHVIETMRPLPITALTGVNPVVRGLAVIRGVPVPVVDLARAMSATSAETTTDARFVALRVGARRVALLVDSVVGVRAIDASTMEMPPLLRAASTDMIESIGAVDAQLLVVLRATRVLTDETWQAIDASASRGAAG
jgi:purine-binding chemotaxis protein CheW